MCGFPHEGLTTTWGPWGEICISSQQREGDDEEKEDSPIKKQNTDASVRNN